jgi:ribokinase
LAPTDIDRAETAFTNSQILLLQLETPLPTVLYAAVKAHDLGLRVCLNAAPALAIPPALLTLVDLLVVNTIEAQMLLSDSTPLDDLAAVRGAATALADSARDVVITLGNRGAVAVTRSGDWHHQVGNSVPVVNTIGAGDAFVGELAARMAEGMALDQALRYANAAGALAVTRHEPQGRTPERAQIEALLATGALP